MIDRKSGEKVEEEIFGGSAIRYLYGKGWLAGLLRRASGRFSWISTLFGLWQRQKWTKKNVAPFIKRFHIDTSEFEKQEFSSFNDFFIRKLKPQCRPIADTSAIIPADGRYRFFPVTQEPLFVKGSSFDLAELLQDEMLAKQFQGGGCVTGRLCPTDCHRFYFPIDCIPGEPRLIHGPLFSVNPIAVKKNLRYLTQNKRYVTELASEVFGKVVFLEVGATNVGSIHQTYRPGKPVNKGDEKGFFSFGGSALIILFEPGAILFSKDLLHFLKESDLEVLCKIGHPLGSIR